MTAHERARRPSATAPPLPAGAANVLIVDGDAVTRRFCELVLDRERLHVEATSTAAAALEVVRLTPCDLIITEARLPDLDGIELVRRLRARLPDGEVPIIVLSADDRVERKVEAFEAGADDYLAKPCAAPELRSRVVRRIARRGGRAASPAHAPLLVAQLAALPLPDLVGVLAMNRRTSTVQVRTPRGDGTLYFQEGRLVHATFLSVTGARAFYHLFAEERGEVSLRDGCEVAEETVRESTTALIMEAARRLDVARATGAHAGPGATARSPALPTRVHRLPPDRELALGFTRDITDTYTLAALELRTVDELTAWSRRASPGPRLQVAVIAPAAVVTTAIASIATAPGERELLAALDGRARTLTAALRGRDGRELDLVGLDPVADLETSRALGQRVDLAIVAAQDRGRPGDLGSAARVLGVLGPTVAVAVGAGAPADALEAALAADRGGTTLGHHAGELGRPGELRRAIGEALRLWLRGAR